VELLHLEGLVKRQQGHDAAAEACWQQIVGDSNRGGGHFASLDPGLGGYVTRHNLAVLYRDQRRHADADAQWRAALNERPDYVPAWVGLAELYLELERWSELDSTLERLQELLDARLEVALLRGRKHWKRHEFAFGRKVLEAGIAEFPQALGLRELLSDLMLDSRDWPGAEQHLRAVLSLVPEHRAARQNLEFVLRAQRDGD